MTLAELNTHLSHKKRTVQDLIRYIGNAADAVEDRGYRAQNYSILLGAGASVTSGIRSGQTLIDEWKKEVYHETDDQNKVSIEDFFKPGNSPEWYDESNPYSSLFENRFDLQRHRRIFVENEVAGKTPSIGYAYLVKLIDNGFFNTVFTTNFDDLLNEAFYRFSNNRPIVCAHDSSISGISVTSKRPKIIKLHGDYLFDDIKTTLRETESLEMNMKMKFQEFAKDFGLIVVGYAGQDRSIMDILTYLLQHEDYFKNGIYWCIRKGEKEIANELKKLLWRDRVYFVEIDGFDEVFSEINRVLNNGLLPIDDTFLSMSHQENIIKDLTENSRLQLDKSAILKDDCRRLKAHFEDNTANDYLRYIRNRKNEHTKTNEYHPTRRKVLLPDLTEDQKKELNDLITEGYGIGHKNSVLKKLDAKGILSMKDSKFKLELLEILTDLTSPLKDEEVKLYFDEMIRLDQNCQRYYEIASNRSFDRKQSIFYLKKAASIFENDSYIINKYVESLIDYYEDLPLIDDYTTELEMIEKLINKSLELSPIIENPVYTHQLRFYRLKYMNQRNLFKDYCKSLSEIICKTIYHPQALYLLDEINSEKLTNDLIIQSLNFYKKADNDKAVESIYKVYIKWKEKNNGFNDVLPIFKQFEKEYVCSDSFKYMKAQMLMKYEYFDDALELLNDFKNNIGAIKKIMSILKFADRRDDIENLFENYKDEEDCQISYFEATNQYGNLVKHYQDILDKKGYLSKYDLNAYAYSLLKCNDFAAVEKLLKPYYDNPNLAEGSLIVNYLYARKMLGHDISKQIKKKILEHPCIEYSDYEKLGAYCVLGNEQESFSCLCNVLKKDPSSRYQIAEWPIITQFKDTPRFSKLFAYRCNKL